MTAPQQVPDVTLPGGFRDGDELIAYGRRWVREGGEWVEVPPDPPDGIEVPD